MNWSKDEIAAFHAAWTAGWESGTLITRIADKASELLAARGGTMTAERIGEIFSMPWVANRVPAEEVQEHLAALGAKVAALEAERDRERTSAEVWRQRCEKAAVALGGVGAGEVGRLDLVSRINMLTAELARLKARAECTTCRGAKTVTPPCEHVGCFDGTIAHDCPPPVPCPGCVRPTPPPEAFHESKGLDADALPACSSGTCNHDERHKPEHAAEVAERSRAFNEAAAMHPNGRCTCAGEGVCAWCDKAARGEEYNRGAEDTRAACWEAVAMRLQFHGLWQLREDFKKAIEGAAP